MKSFGKLNLLLLVVVLALLVTGCATNRGIVSIKQPNPVISETGSKQAFIRSVVDKREFQENPSNPEIPSLGFEGSSGSSSEIKKRAIARKRNSFGKALGDILLEENQTVETVMNDALRRSLSALGYKIVKNEQEVSSDTLVIDSTIQRFWAHMTPGFASIRLTSNVSTTLAITSPKAVASGSETISTKAEGHYQTGAGKNWMEVIHQALEKYVEEVKTRLSGKY